MKHAVGDVIQFDYLDYTEGTITHITEIQHNCDKSRMKFYICWYTITFDDKTSIVINLTK